MAIRIGEKSTAPSLNLLIDFSILIICSLVFRNAGTNCARLKVLFLAIKLVFFFFLHNSRRKVDEMGEREMPVISRKGCQKVQRFKS